MTRKCRRAKRRRCYSSMKYSAPINNACQAPSNIPYTQKRELTYNVRSLLYYACFVNLTVPSKMCFPYVLKAASQGAVIDEDGFAPIEQTTWKEENGKFFYDTKVEGEVLGETVNPFAEIPVDENGCLTIAFGTMILERM